MTAYITHIVNGRIWLVPEELSTETFILAKDKVNYNANDGKRMPFTYEEALVFSSVAKDPRVIMI